MMAHCLHFFTFIVSVFFFNCHYCVMSTRSCGILENLTSFRWQFFFSLIKYEQFGLDKFFLKFVNIRWYLQMEFMIFCSQYHYQHLITWWIFLKTILFSLIISKKCAIEHSHPFGNLSVFKCVFIFSRFYFCNELCSKRMAYLWQMQATMSLLWASLFSTCIIIV